MRFLILIVSLLLYVSSVSAEEKMLQSGTFSVGGTAQIPFKFDKDGSLRMDMRLDASFSYFVWKGLSIGIRPLLGFFVFDRRHKSLWGAENRLQWGASLPIIYHYPLTKDLFIFGGIEPGFSMWDFVQQTLKMWGRIPVGVHYFLTPHVALTASVSTRIKFNLERIFDGVEVVPGVLGFTIFF